MDALDEVGDADVVRGQSEGCADLDEFGFALAEERAGENAVGVLSGCGWMDWDERFRRWMRVPSLSVRPSVPVKCKYKDFETLFFFFSSRVIG